MTGEWWCEAYGPPPEGMPAANWPRCFLPGEVDERHCANAATCASVMASERRRVFARINELAVEDGEFGAVYRQLAEDIPTPGELLGGNAVLRDPDEGDQDRDER